MKVMIVTSFNHYENIRLKFLVDYFEKSGYETHCILSDYDHMGKCKVQVNRNNCNLVETIPYKKNISFYRLYSHVDFSKKAYNIVEKFKPDILYVIVPPNSLIKVMAKYKRKNNVKLLFDIFDLWPETMPVGNMKSFLKWPFNIWRDIRDKNLKYADYVITECDLYQEVLKDKLMNLNSSTLYLCKEEQEHNANQKLDLLNLNICYLGSINNIIDIDMIEKVLVAINQYKKVVLHIIGDGESRDDLIDTIRGNHIDVIFHGKIFDEKEKKEIMSNCHFGLNIMKESVVVGLTMKSIDYFKANLPVLNNIQSDSYKLVNKYNTGYNINEYNLDEVAKIISELTNVELIQMKKNTKKIFDKYFTTQVFYTKLEKILKKVFN